MRTRHGRSLWCGLCLMLAGSGCSGPSEPDRYRAIGEVAATPEPIFADLGQNRLRIRLDYGGGCCDARGEIETQVQGRTVRLIPYYSDVAGCELRCLTSFTYDDTLAFETPGPVDIRVVAPDSVSLAIDTTVALD